MLQTFTLLVVQQEVVDFLHAGLGPEAAEVVEGGDLIGHHSAYGIGDEVVTLGAHAQGALVRREAVLGLQRTHVVFARLLNCQQPK